MQSAMDAVEDGIFAKFSKALGVASVREYEETAVTAAREREASLLALKTSASKLRSKLLYEKRRDVPKAVAKARARRLRRMNRRSPRASHAPPII